MADNIIQKGFRSLLGQDFIEKTLASGDKPGGSKGYIDIIPQDQTLGARTPTNYMTLYRIYKQEPWVRAAVDAITRTTTSLGWTVVPVKEDVSGDLGDDQNDTKAQELLLEFFNWCNPDETFNDILYGLASDIQIYGNAYLEVVKGQDGLPKELWVLDATSIRVRYDVHGYITGYVQRLGSHIVYFDPDEVIHLRLNSKGSTLYGLSPIESVIATVDVDLKAQIYTRKYYENFGAPKGLFKMKNASPEQVRRNRLYLSTQVAGIENAHRNLMLEGDVDYQPLATGFRDTETLKVRKFLRDEIIAVFGVPPSKIQVIESGNIGGGTGKTQDKTFLEETIYPLQNKLAAKINQKLIRELFGIDDWKLEFVREDNEDELQKAKVHDFYLRDGVLSVNEVRADLGYEALEEEADYDTQAVNDQIIDPNEDMSAAAPEQGTPAITEAIVPAGTGAPAAKPQNAKEQVESPSKRKPAANAQAAAPKNPTKPIPNPAAAKDPKKKPKKKVTKTVNKTLKPVAYF